MSASIKNEPEMNRREFVKTAAAGAAGAAGTTATRAGGLGALGIVFAYLAAHLVEFGCAGRDNR